MSNYDFLSAVYDILAQNNITQDIKNEITEVIDYVDYDTNEIVFTLDNGRSYTLQLTNL